MRMANAQEKENQNPELPHEEKGDGDGDEAFTCEICTEPVIIPNKKFNNDNKCIHPFCSVCIVKYIKAKLDDDISEIRCPAPDCKYLLEPLASRSKIPHQLFDKWSDLLFNTIVLPLDSVYCPNGDCSSLVLNECGGNVTRSTCPQCKTLFCFRCKLHWHAGYRCKETLSLNDPNDVAFGKLMERSKWQRCPRCGQCVERITGCNLVRCRCGAFFNYSNPTRLGLARSVMQECILVVVLLVELTYIICFYVYLFLLL